jgi:hypothetical protein
MKSIIFRPTALAAICAIALVTSVVAPRAHADEWDQRTILTVKQPIQVRQVVLDPGTYVMKLYNSSAIRDIVQIYTADERHLVDTVQATPAYRPRPTDTMFTYWETPAGTMPAMRTWFYPGQLIGQSFPYPDHPRQLASTTQSSTQTLNTQPAEPPAPPTEPQTSAQESESNSEADRSADVAENSAPPEPAAEPAPAPEPESTPAAAPEPQNTPAQPAQMPKTASPFPLIGLSGALMLGLGGLLRLVRLS